MPVERIQPEGLPKPPTYSHVVRAGPSGTSGQVTIYLAGQVAQNERGEVVGKGDIVAQTTQVFENMQKALTAADADFRDLVKITVFVTDARFRESMAEVRSRYLRDRLPASTFVVVAGLASPDYLIEIEGIAVVDRG